jgi:RNA polymerase sigma-70 factor (ECF subfamily)
LKKSDQDLVEEARLGDVGSFRELYERHYPMVVGLACSRLRDSHLADVFVVACRSLSSLKDGSRFPQWIGTITRRIANSIARSIRETTSLPNETSIASNLEKASENSHVRKAIEKLSTNQREVVYLKYFSELSYQQIADATNTTPVSVHGRLQRARRSLGKTLGTISNEVNDER